MRRATVVATLLGLSAAQLRAQIPSDARASIETYQAALKAVQAAPRAGALEKSLDRLDAVQEALMRVRVNGSTVLQAMSDSEFERVSSLPGMVINREEVVFVKPDPDYFLRLAAVSGDSADRTFFKTYKLTYPEGVWASYETQQTDYSSCTEFGNGKLVDAYRAWSDFQRRFPNRYRARSKAQIDEVSTELTESTCACGDSASVEREMQEFLRAFSGASIAAAVRDRLRALGTPRSKIRLRCLSG
jgi:hypothetical protein